MTDAAPAEALDILAIGAHPDDVELFAGGALALAAQDGARVGVVALSAGELGTRGTVETRAAEFAASMKLLGAAWHTTLALPDGAILDTPAHRATVAATIRATRPRLVLTHAPHDRHPDHDGAHALLRAACFWSHLANAPVDGAPHRVEALRFFLGNHEPDPPRPSLVVDVTATFATKLACLRCYATQFHGGASSPAGASPITSAGANAGAAAPETFISSSDYWEWIELRARYYGRLIGARHGEPFLADGPLRATLLGQPAVQIGPPAGQE